MEYIEKINDHHAKLQAMQHISYHDKLAINSNNELYIQYKTPWRYMVRRIKNQNRHRLSEYLSTIINEYIKMIEILINIYNADNNDDIRKLLYNIIEFISKIFSGIISLRNYYNLKDNSHQIGMTLESINNRLHTTLSKIKLII